MKAGKETRLGQFFPASLFLTVVVIFAFTLNISSAQSFNQILSAKHIQKIENTGSARDKIKQYKRLYSKDSLRQLKEAERYWKNKSDSLFSLKENYDTSRLKPDTLMFLEHLDQYDSIQLDSIRDLAISRIKSEADNSEYGQRVNAIQDKYLTAVENDSLLKNVSDQLIQKSQSEFSQLSQVNELGGQIHQFKNYDPWDNEYKAKVDQLADSAFVKELLKRKAEDLAAEYLSENRELLQAAKSRMDVLMKKYSVVPNSNDLSSAVKRISLKGRPFRERLLIGTNFQVLSLEPLAIDFSPLLGYKFNSNFVMGVGGTYRQSFNDSLPQISPDVLSYGVFARYAVIRNFFANVEYSVNTVRSSSSETQIGRVTEKSLIVGVGRKFLVHQKVDMTVIVGYNFLHTRNSTLYQSPWSVKVGFQSSDLAFLKKKPNASHLIR